MEAMWCDEHKWLTTISPKGFPVCDGKPHLVSYEEREELYSKMVKPQMEAFFAEIERLEQERS